jgi:hypothetical protein
MKVEPDAASRGVRTRLIGALVALGVTLACIVSIVSAPLSTFSATFAFTMGLSSFGAAIGLVMSARHEEEIHQLAARLDRSDVFEPVLESDEADESLETSDAPDGSRELPPTDGHV